MNRNRHRGAGRCGTTLLEMLATLSVLLVLGVASANLLRAVTEVGSYNAHRKQVRSSVLRLAESLRLDVQNARSLAPGDESWPLVMTTAGATVKYDWDANSHAIERSRGDGDSRIGVERFQLSDHCQAKLSLTPDLVKLELNEGDQNHPWIIEAHRG